MKYGCLYESVLYSFSFSVEFHMFTSHSLNVELAAAVLTIRLKRLNFSRSRHC